MKQYQFKLMNLDCANCANKLERALEKIELIEKVKISFITQKLTFECHEKEKEKALETIRKIIKKEEPDIKLEED